MNQLKNFVIALIVIVSFTFSCQAQNELVLGIEYGNLLSINKNETQLNLFEEGSNANLGLTYFFGKYGFTAGVRTVFARAQRDTSYEDIIGLIRAGQNGATHGRLSAYAGPTVRFGKGKFGVIASPKIGVLRAGLTELIASRELSDGQTILTTLVQEKAQLMPFLSGEIGLNFKLTPKVGLQLKADYSSNQMFKKGKPVFNPLEEGIEIPNDEVLNPELLTNLISSELKQVNVSMGLQVTLGGNKHGSASRGNVVSIPLKKACDCYKNCLDDQLASCKDNKRNCKNDAKQCKRSAKSTFKSCKSNCTGSRKQKRQCKKSCRKTFKSAKKQCKQAKKRCKRMKCKKSSYKDACQKKCGCN